MRYFAQFLLAAFSEIAKSLGLFVSKKVAMFGAAAAISLVLLTAFYASMKLLIAGLMRKKKNEYILLFFWLIWPSNAEFCISAYWSAWLGVFLYREYRVNLRRAMQ
jgi:hypothetical protein